MVLTPLLAFAFTNILLCVRFQEDVIQPPHPFFPNDHFNIFLVIDCFPICFSSQFMRCPLRCYDAPTFVAKLQLNLSRWSGSTKQSHKTGKNLPHQSPFSHARGFQALGFWRVLPVFFMVWGGTVQQTGP
jgi:hypothetical protein